MHEDKIRIEDGAGCEYLTISEVCPELIGIIEGGEDVEGFTQIFGSSFLRGNFRRSHGDDGGY